MWVGCAPCCFHLGLLGLIVLADKGFASAPPKDCEPTWEDIEDRRGFASAPPNCEPTWEEIEDRRRGENLALRGKATLSDLYGNGFAYNAIDGNRDGIYDHGSCARTKAHLTPWWRVNLLQKYKVFSVIITTEASAPERLDGAEIRIGNSLVDNSINNPRCDIIASIPAGFSVTYECNGMVGRYVTIVIPGRIESLLLCEVEFSMFLLFLVCIACNDILYLHFLCYGPWHEVID